MEVVADEQAGFRTGFSTTDLLQTKNQLIEKAKEYNFPVYLYFLDFKKAFDGILHASIFKALRTISIEEKYIRVLAGLYREMTAFIMTEKKEQIFLVKRDVHQGDSLSPLLLILVLKMVFWHLRWENVGINIYGRWLSNLRFADDIVLFAQDGYQLKEMLEHLLRLCEVVGLHPNCNKTKKMTNSKKEEIKANN